MHYLNIMTVMFIVLKLAGVITWSWFLVLAPTLIPILISLTVLGFCIIILLTVDARDE